MCDCYGHKCNAKGCTERIPMHIGDFNYPRTSFKCWCRLHIDKAAKHPGAVIFTVDKVHDWDDDDDLFVGWQCAVLGPEVGSEGDNSPNVAAEYTELRISGERKPLSAYAARIEAEYRERCAKHDAEWPQRWEEIKQELGIDEREEADGE